MDPIEKHPYNPGDFQKFVTQDLFKELYTQHIEFEKKQLFKQAEKANKSKKDQQKQKEKKKRPFEF